MKKLLILMLGVTLLAGCEPKKKGNSDKLASEVRYDSLLQAFEQSKNESGDLIETMNQIEAGFEELTEVEGTVNQIKEGGVTSANRERIIQMMAQLQQTMKLNKERIAELEEQLRVAQQADPKLREATEKKIQNYETLLAQKESSIAALMAELKRKDATIAQKEAEITDLSVKNTDLTTRNADLHAKNEELGAKNTELGQKNDELASQNRAKDATIAANKEDIASKAKTIANQDQAMHTAYYVFGTKRELKAQHILEDGQVMRSKNMNQDYFTKIDLRVTKTIKLYSKKAQIYTNHPAGSYTLGKDEQGQYTLRITDPQRFWSASRYLVVMVK